MRLINIEREANTGGVSAKVMIEVFPPLSIEIEDKEEEKEEALKEMYGTTAGMMANYLCSSQKILEEDQCLGLELFRVLSKHMKNAVNEATQLIMEKGNPDKDFLISYQ